MITYEERALAALGDPTRLTIFRRVADGGPLAVGAIAAELPVSRPAVSQHLRVLKDAGLLVEQRAGTRRLYEVDPAGMQALATYFDRFWNRALLAFKAKAESSGER